MKLLIDFWLQEMPLAAEPCDTELIRKISKLQAELHEADQHSCPVTRDESELKRPLAQTDSSVGSAGQAGV